MTIAVLTPKEIEKMRLAGRVARATLLTVGAKLRAGISTADIDRWVREDTQVRGGTPSQLGYKGFPSAVCTSRNDVVCHGMPNAKDVLADGDIINVDVTTEFGGYHGDTSITFAIGEISQEAKHVVRVAENAMLAGISQVREGARLGDIGFAVEDYARREGCTVVRDFGGHGIGRHMHAPPHVNHFGQRGMGVRLKAGMCITIEPMVNLGKPQIRMDKDGWTVRTEDGSLSAQFEHTVLVTKTGAEVLTLHPA